MASLVLSITKFGKHESAATAIEYGLIAALVGVGVVLALGVLNTEIGGLFNYIISTAGVAIANAFN